MKRRTLMRSLAVAGAGCAAASFWPRGKAQQSRPLELTFVSYAVARPVYSLIIPAFIQEWKAQTGQDVRFIESYGPSGAQTRAINAGLNADILVQNLESFVTPLVETGLVRADWKSRYPHNSSPKRSAMAIMTRADNPKGIQTWADLGKPCVELVAINPQTAGFARLGVVAAYGAIQRDRGDAAAQEFLLAFVKNIVSLVGGGREASDAFIQNQVGDALVTSEAELVHIDSIFPNEYKGTVPDSNLITEFPTVVIDEVVDRKGTREAAEAFIEFLYSPVAQELYALTGYRPVNEPSSSLDAKYRDISNSFTIADLGGWEVVNPLLFEDGALFDQALAATNA